MGKGFFYYFEVFFVLFEMQAAIKVDCCDRTLNENYVMDNIGSVHQTFRRNVRLVVVCCGSAGGRLKLSDAICGFVVGLSNLLQTSIKLNTMSHGINIKYFIKASSISFAA